MDGLVVRPYKRLRESFTFQQPLVWRNVIGITTLHILAAYSMVFLLHKIYFKTLIWGLVIGNLSGLGVTAGAHRLWAHRTYKARLPLRIVLMLLYITAGQYSLESWVKDHRSHHKNADTNADPHNAKRGFFFSHCGWLMMKRHPEVKSKGKLIDISDLRRDPVVEFQQKYFVPLLLFFFVLIPSAVPYIFWNESFYNVVMTVFFFRYALQLNLTWIVNSFAHFYGTKPYNKNILAVQNLFVSIFALGEGWHNFHHVFPWDYRVGEVGELFQTTALFLEICARLGLAYDLKSASPEMVARVLSKQITTEIPEEDIKNEELKMNVEKLTVEEVKKTE